MNKLLFRSLLVAVLTCVVVLTGCGRDEAKLRKAVEDAGKDCPFVVDGMFTLTRIYLDDGNVGADYICSELYATSLSAVDDEGLKANMVTSLASSREFLDAMVDADAGMNLYFKDADGNELRTVRINGEELKDLVNKLDRGELERPSFLKQTQAEIDKMDFPVDMGNDIWLTGMEIQGSTIIYSYDVPNGTFFDESAKKELVNTLKQTYSIRMEDIVDENVNFLYSYKDSDGNTVGAIFIKPSDLQ